MTRKQRFFLFFLMLLLFIVAGPSIVFYSQGYRIDFQAKKIVQTGAFYFRITPKNVQIEIIPLLNGKTRVASTDFIFGTAYVENLLPGKYEVKVSKKDYYDWRKILEINEKIATEIKNITLIPKNPEFEIIAEQVDDFFYFPEKNITIIKKRTTDNWTLLVYDSKNQTFFNFFSLNSQENLVNLKELSKFNQILIETEKNGKINYYLATINKKDNFITLDLPSEIKKISFHPKENQKLIFLKDNTIFSYDYETKKILLLLNNVIDYSFDLSEEFFWLSNEGFLMKTIEGSNKVNRTPLEINQDQEYEIILPNYFEKIIKTNNNFYFFDGENSIFKKLFENPYNPIVSPNLDKIAYSNGHEIKILFFEKTYDQPQRNRLDNVFLTRYSEVIKNISWYTAHYLIFTIFDQIKIIEIDNRDNINTIDLIEFKNPKIYFNLSDNKLYILSENQLFVSEKFIP